MKFYTNVSQQHGKIYVRGYENGQRFNERLPFSPTLFIESDEPSNWTTIDGRKVSPVKLGSISDARDFLERYKEVDNFQVYGQAQFVYAYLAENYPQETIEWNIDWLRILTIDIEVASENGFPFPSAATEPVTAITIMDRTSKDIVSFGCGDFTPHHENVKYYKCKDEADLLRCFVTYWQSNLPDVVTGWNVQKFDIPYLVNRICKIHSEDMAKKLSAWGIRERKVKNDFGGEDQIYELDGVAVLDYLDLYKKFTYKKKEQYTLNFIATEELGEEKMSYEEYDNLFHLYKDNFQKFMEYNVRDVWLVYRLEKKLRMIELCITMAYDAKINYREVFSPIKFWDILIYNHLWKKKVVVPQQEGSFKRQQYRGAYVKPSQMGLHKWVVAFDATSLYPSFYLQYNISPETLADPVFDQEVSVEELVDKTVDLEWLKEQNLGMAANGVCFHNDRIGHFPELVRRFFDDRQKYKKLMLESKQKYQDTKDDKHNQDAARYEVYQMARKISLNSLYGAAGSPFFRFFSIRQAEAITVSGQMMFKRVEKDMNIYMNKLMGNTTFKDYVIHGDTDSIYVSLDDLVQKVFPTRVDPRKIEAFIIKVCDDKLSHVLESSCKDVAEYTNAFTNAVYFKREKIADSGIWTAKKRYILRVYNNEGVSYDPPKVEVTGIEVVRSSTPKLLRDMLKEAIEVVLNDVEKDLWTVVEGHRAMFFAAEIEEIAFPRSWNGSGVYGDPKSIYIKGTPQQVRAGLLYNDLIVRGKLDRKYRSIQEGDKMKLVFLKEPNPLRENVIGFPSSLPKEFKLHKFVDYETMFSKGYVEPLKAILDELAWSVEKVNSVDSLFD